MLDLTNVTYLSFVANSHDALHNVDNIIRIGKQTSKNINFGEKIIYSCQEPSIDPGEFNVVMIDEVPYKNFNNYVLENFCHMFDTEYMINFHYDGFIQNYKAWTNDFFRYDYIGAIINWGNKKICGNGGFSLRSKGICSEICGLYKKYGNRNSEDVFISHTCKSELMLKGFKFAPLAVCSSFSTEHYVYSEPSDYYESFGMHEINKLFNNSLKSHRRKMLDEMLCRE